MATFCLLAPVVAAADAIGHDIAGMFAVLRDHGVETHLFALDGSVECGLPVEPMAAYEAHARRTDAVSIYHHSSIGGEACERFMRCAGSRVVRYHNVTPPGFFAPYCGELEEASAVGRLQTAALVQSGRLDLVLADSDYNARELIALGAPAERCRVIAPFHALATIEDQPAAVRVLERYLDGTCNVLFVGRVAPNKGHRHLLGVLSAYRKLFRRPIRLLVVGDLDPRLRSYHDQLRALAIGLGVADDVVFTGRVSDAELKAYYLLAHAFLVMAEHEGFCVPVVEAMAHAVPILAHAAAAVPETIGDAGIIVDGLDYDHYAAALELLFSRDDCRAPLIALARRRVAERFAHATLARQLSDALAPWLARRPPGEPAPVEGFAGG
jgi:glycosyltransferase involved in cell wall biosynthesis